MNCNEARRMITSYVKKELSDRELEQFLFHVEHCSDCMDELDTYYTVYQALDLLDSGGHHDYDFRRMLREDLRASQRRLIRRSAAGMIFGIVMILTEILLAASVYTGYEIEKGQAEHTMIQRALLRVNWRSETPDERGGTGSQRPELSDEKGKTEVIRMPEDAQSESEERIPADAQSESKERIPADAQSESKERIPADTQNESKERMTEVQRASEERTTDAQSAPKKRTEGASGE